MTLRDTGRIQYLQVHVLCDQTERQIKPSLGGVVGSHLQTSRKSLCSKQLKQRHLVKGFILEVKRDLGRSAATVPGPEFEHTWSSSAQLVNRHHQNT